MDDLIGKKIGVYWSEKKTLTKTRWWDSPTIIRYINSIVNGEHIGGLSAGLINRAKFLLGDRLPLEKGVSVGGGNGFKEMELIQKGIVKSFDLFELSADRISKGRILAKEKGLTNKITFKEGDAFSMVNGREIYVLVHWNNSLHHMMDVFHAVHWSKQILKPDGLFYLDDFVGSNRFQWPEKQLQIASEVRKSLIGAKYLRNPYKKNYFTRKDCLT